VTRLYVGGVPHENTTAMHEPAAPLPFHPANNLRGCLRQVGLLDAIRLLHQHRRSIVTDDDIFFLSFYFLLLHFPVGFCSPSSPWKQARSTWNCETRWRMVATLHFRRSDPGSWYTPLKMESATRICYRYLRNGAVSLQLQDGMPTVARRGDNSSISNSSSSNNNNIGRCDVRDQDGPRRDDN